LVSLEWNPQPTELSGPCGSKGEHPATFKALDPTGLEKAPREQATERTRQVRFALMGVRTPMTIQKRGRASAVRAIRLEYTHFPLL
jgi:hypothetical protein